MIRNENVSIVDQLLEASDPQSCCQARYQFSRAMDAAEELAQPANTKKAPQAAIKNHN